MILYLLDEFFRILDSFDSFSLRYVYREWNSEANLLSKEGLQLDFGKWLISEIKDGTHYAYYQKLFIDPPSHRGPSI
jgi:hypothetical protein